MADYVLSGEADNDVLELFQNSIALWGIETAERYLQDLHHLFETLGQFPFLGRDIGDLRPGYARFEYRSHAIFYRRSDSGIYVVRVLHRRQQPRNYL